MIDTVIYRIQGYEKYKHIVKFLETVNTDSYVKKFRHEGLESVTRTSVLFADTDRVLDISMRTSINVASSHYNISCNPNKERDYIELNLSIPKYLHSTNVLQFIDQHDETTKHTFEKFLNFSHTFFNEIFPLPPDWEDVEINRIDFCYNQFFLSKTDALRYLDEQKKLNIEYARSDTNKFTDYNGTTVQYKTDNYSFKIYHKGTEWRKHDYSKLLKNNPKNIDLPEMALISDNILRYELTARKGLLNYLFKQRLVNDENTIVNHHLSQIIKTRSSARNKIVNNVRGKALIYSSTSDEVEIFVNKTIKNKRFSFHLSSIWEDLNSKPRELMDCYNFCFNQELFCELHSFFWERVNKYQLGVKLGLIDIHQKIKDQQSDTKMKNELFGEDKQNSSTGLLLLIATLSQYTDISELKTVIPKATFYRYRKKLEDLGIPRHSPEIAVAPPPLDYLQYYYYFSKYHKTYG